MGPWSQHFSFFEAYKWSHLASVFHLTWLERLVRGQTPA